MQYMNNIIQYLKHCSISRKLSAMLLCLWLSVSCTAILEGRISNLEDRVSRLELYCEELNTNISALQAIVSSIQRNECITSINPIEQGGTVIGYTIIFANSSPITVYNGESGNDGKDGHSPIIGVSQDNDEAWYWTLDGQWLLDTNGQKVRAIGVDGTDGKDGITPILKIEEGYWYVSTDNGYDWTNLGRAIDDYSDDTIGIDTVFQNIIISDNEVTFITSDGQSFTVCRARVLSIVFDTSSSIALPPNTTYLIQFTVFSSVGDINVDAWGVGSVKAKVVSTDAYTGCIYIETGDVIDDFCKVVVTVSDSSQTIIRTISIKKIETTNKVIVWGHSAGVIIEPFIKAEIESILDIEIDFEACSVNGEDMLQIAARQGSLPPLFADVDCSITDSGYRIANYDYPFHSSFGNEAISFSIINGFNPCTINGVKGTLTLTGSTYYFTPDGDKEIVLTSQNAVMSYASTAFNNALMTIFWCDQGSDKSNLETLIKKYERMTSFVGNNNYLIEGSITGTDEKRAQSEKLLLERFGEHFFNGRLYLLSEARKEISDVTSEEDIERMKMGQLPSFFMKDDVHLNERAARILSQKLVEVLMNSRSVQAAIINQ